VSRGRRFETSGFGAVTGALLVGIDPRLAIGYAFALIGLGLALQVRADRRRHTLPKGVEIVKDGEHLEGKERQEALEQHGRLLIWEAAGRPGLPDEVVPGEVEIASEAEQ